MELIETSVFTKQVQTHLSDDEYRALQLALVLRPDGGKVIPGSGGLRKIRWGRSGTGKHGGLRIIYFWHPDADRLFLLFLYPKSSQSDLSPTQLRMLRRLVYND